MCTAKVCSVHNAVVSDAVAMALGKNSRRLGAKTRPFVNAECVMRLKPGVVAHDEADILCYFINTGAGQRSAHVIQRSTGGVNLRLALV
jgi:hypothetical protein